MWGKLTEHEFETFKDFNFNPLERAVRDLRKSISSAALKKNELDKQILARLDRLERKAWQLPENIRMAAPASIYEQPEYVRDRCCEKCPHVERRTQ